MSEMTSAPNWGGRAIAAGLLALLLTALAAAGLAPRASADFTTGKCAGTTAAGEGGSFARDAQAKFNENFKLTFCKGTPGFASLNVSYSPEGSSAGFAAMTDRTKTPRFGGTDDPPTPLQIEQMNAGATDPSKDTKTDDNAKVHVFPIAVGSVVALVNFPDTCNPEQLTNPFRTVSKKEIEDFPAKKGLLRVRMPKKLFEKVWAGEANASWSEAFPDLTGCTTPITRVVRFDGSGTTFTLKDYLHTINPARGWKTTFATVGNKTLDWPNAEFGSGAKCGGANAPGKKPDDEDHLTSGCAKGNGELIKKLGEVDGSIGYADLATARNSSPTLAINAAGATAPTTPYWTQVQNGSITPGTPAETEGKGFTEPTADEVNGFKTAAGGPTKGSNCLEAEFKNVPSTSFGDWSNTSGVNSTKGWGICTMTYALVFDDNAAAWGNKIEEESKARTIKDYQESIVSDAGQAQLFGADYAPVPDQYLPISRKAVAEIGWNKSSSTGNPTNTNPGNTNPGGGSGGGGGGGVAKPSNRFSVPRTTISSAKGTATFSVKLPGAGKLDLVGSAKNKGKKVKVGHVILTAGKAGTYSVTLKPSAAAKSLLEEKGSLKVSLKFTFTPTGGDAGDLASSVKLKLTAKP